jgi:hypothetical protein
MVFMVKTLRPIDLLILTASTISRKRWQMGISGRFSKFLRESFNDRFEGLKVISGVARRGAECSVFDYGQVAEVDDVLVTVFDSLNVA